MVRRVLLALDGKKHADYAFNWYLENLNRPNDEVVLFHCAQFFLNVGVPGVMVNVDHVSKQVLKAKEEAERIVGTAAEVLKAKGIKGYSVCKHDPKPDEALLKTIDEEKVDYVVMGTRDLGAVKRTLVGSVSTSVVRHAKVPVTIVKSPI